MNHGISGCKSLSSNRCQNRLAIFKNVDELESRLCNSFRARTIENIRNGLSQICYGPRKLNLPSTGDIRDEGSIPTGKQDLEEGMQPPC